MKRKDIRHERVQDRATGDILERRNAYHDQGQADDTDDTCFFIITPFEQLRDGCAVQ